MIKINVLYVSLISSFFPVALSFSMLSPYAKTLIATVPQHTAAIQSLTKSMESKDAEIQSLKKELSEIKGLLKNGSDSHQEKSQQGLEQRFSELQICVTALKARAEHNEQEFEKRLNAAFSTFSHNDQAWAAREATLKSTVQDREIQISRLQESRERLKNGLALLPPTYASSNPRENSLIDLLKNELGE